MSTVLKPFKFEIKINLMFGNKVRLQRCVFGVLGTLIHICFIGIFQLACMTFSEKTKIKEIFPKKLRKFRKLRKKRNINEKKTVLESENGYTLHVIYSWLKLANTDI